MTTEAGPDRRSIGARAEARAAALLESAGLTILARNFRGRVGEIDLVAQDGAALVIVEVRARRHRSHGGAAASVNFIKRARLVRAANLLLAAHPDWRRMPVRFDVVAFDGEDDAPSWIRHAFEA
jgi:putative endonuclease